MNLLDVKCMFQKLFGNLIMDVGRYSNIKVTEYNLLQAVSKCSLNTHGCILQVYFSVRLWRMWFLMLLLVFQNFK